MVLDDRHDPLLGGTCRARPVISASASSSGRAQRPVAGSIPKPKDALSVRRRSPLLSRLIIAPSRSRMADQAARVRRLARNTSSPPSRTGHANTVWMSKPWRWRSSSLAVIRSWTVVSTLSMRSTCRSMRYSRHGSAACVAALASFVVGGAAFVADIERPGHEPAVVVADVGGSLAL